MVEFADGGTSDLSAIFGGDCTSSRQVDGFPFSRASVLFSKTQEYALQALIHLALTPTVFRLNRDVAEQLEVPGPYLAKVLKKFAQLGYLDSAKGRGGGYRIRKRAMEAPVREIVTVADGNDPFVGCLLGLNRCSDHAACPIHDKWMPLREKVAVLLEQQTIGELAQKARAGRTRLAPLRKVATKVMQATTGRTATKAAPRQVRR